MNFKPEQIQTVPELKEGYPNVENVGNTSSLTASFLGKEIDLINPETILEIENGVNTYREKAEGELGQESEGKKMVSYDKYNKSFIIDGDKFSLGQIVSARRQGVEFYLPESLNESGDGKKLIKMMQSKLLEDKLYGKLNKELATVLSEKTKHSDMLVSKAYSEIAERADKESKQFGVVAEKIVLSVLEKIAIDRSDLGITVRETNAYEDVENKIDFIIQAKHKVRGVGVNRQDYTFEEKSIGIQFTVNTSKHEHKSEQIAKAKVKGVEVDDIIYVEINPKLLSDAIKKWETNGKKISGPFEYLPKDIQTSVIVNLLSGVITEDQEKSLSK